MQFYKRFACAALALAVCAPAADAATVGFELRLSNTASSGGTADAPRFTVANTSDGTAATLDRLTFTIGNTAFGFDRVTAIDYSAASSVVFADAANLAANDLLRTDVLDIAIGGLGAGELIRFYAEIDADGLQTSSNYRNVFFGNGTNVPNSTITGYFSSGDVLSLEIASGQQTNITGYTFGIEADEFSTTAVPLPAALPLAAAGFGVLGLAASRRRKA